MKTLGLRDIIGPIMVGPSSSHTAGALRIALMARNLCGSAPQKAVFRLLGSFAHTYQGHGTDKALVAGMLGFAADDLRVRDSFRWASAKGLAFSFTPDPQADDFAHPNTIDVTVTDESGCTVCVRGESIGGGAAVITRLDGIDVHITGEHTSVVVRQRDEAGVLAHIARCLSDEGVNIATTRMFRE
ncbi:MAG: L-serine ammonia-lyase, iron-sulfur-dependent subunit beta, partial [Ellagibacter isourolithinifaciens]